MSFHMTGCSGHEPANHAAAVANAMCEQASFLYHLGDISYDDADDTNRHHMYNRQFFAPYTDYPHQIVAIAGNHDGKASPKAKKSAVDAFLADFCADPAKWPAKWDRNTTDNRPAMIQPYPYWRFDTPARVLHRPGREHLERWHARRSRQAPGLHERAAVQVARQPTEAGQDTELGPAPGFETRRLRHGPLPALFGRDELQRPGDPRNGETPKQEHAPYLANALQRAFAASAQRPDAIFSAHAHLFQRLTYTYADDTVMPCVIIGNGGHWIEHLFEEYDGSAGQAKQVPFPAVAPESFSFPAETPRR